ncbi:MAG: metallophosphoesterase family protein [Gammaproteobacteria bacterium]
MIDPDSIVSVDAARYRRIAIVADTHGPFHAQISAALQCFDCVVHAGDLGGWNTLGLDTRVVYAVAGNNDTKDKWPLAEAATLATLPQVLALSLDGGELVVIHGHQFAASKTRHIKLRAAFPWAKAVVYGHSHRAVIDKSAKPWVLNPGASGRVRGYGGSGYLALSISSRGWTVRRVCA